MTSIERQRIFSSKHSVLYSMYVGGGVLINLVRVYLELVAVEEPTHRQSSATEAQSNFSTTECKSPLLFAQM